ISGILGGIGTFYFLFSNAVMLGSFQYFFYEQKVFWASVRGIWIHGSMEIFAMVIEAGAGFILGASILFPKTYSRLNSFKIGLKNGLKIWFSTIPFTIAAGLLEGFITRYALDMPTWLSILIILSTLSLISWYYLIYPFKVNRKFQKLSAAL
ncbi:MAG: stage II sporulation protein M, partial [Sphingobacteriales bacterium]